MEASASFDCPWCGHRIELVVDTSTDTQQLTTDCEVCCRPIDLLIESEPGRVLSVQVQ